MAHFKAHEITLELGSISLKFSYHADLLRMFILK